MEMNFSLDILFYQPSIYTINILILAHIDKNSLNIQVLLST
jgi:hypothetical protein